MKCPKCGTTMSDHYCMKCGYLKGQGTSYQIKKDVSDQSELEKTLGIDYNKFLRKKFNFSAFFFTYYYLLHYRFYWLGGIFSFLHFIGIWIFLKGVNVGFFNGVLRFLEEYILVFFPLFNLGSSLTLFLLLSVLFRFIFGILFNPWMIRYAKKAPEKAHFHQKKSRYAIFICITIELLLLLGIFYSYRYLGWFHGFI